MKRLFFDIEVSPNVGFFWQSGYKLQVGYDSIIKEREIICICYKWQNSKRIHYLTWDKNQSDKEMVKKFAAVVGLADEVVGHNGDRFDLAWIRTRALKHKVKFSPTIKSYDTLKEAKRLFKFNSNRLDYIGHFLGHGKKIQTSYDLWKKIILDKNKTSLNLMVEYCKRDVELLENVFNSLNSYIKPKSHVGEYACECPECGSDNLTIEKRRISASGVKSVQLQCGDCGKYHTVPEKKYYNEKRIKEYKNRK